MPFSKLIDITGQRFGRLLVIERADDSPGGRVRWRSKCDCGGETISLGYSLRGGATKSCGCLSAELTGNRRRTHGARGSSEYRSWQCMKSRCHNPNSDRFEWYGARGISVCSRWRESFEVFLHDMGPKPSPKHSIDRINNDGNYEPNNCRWATPLEQAQNKRPRRTRVQK